MASDASAAERSTSDAFFGGRITLKQPVRGHRAGLDAVLLAAGVPAGFAGQAYDAGAGVGTAGLGVAIRCEAARVGLIELDPLAVALARENVAANGLAKRVAVHAGDLLAEADTLAKADLVLTNPPFYEAGTVRASADTRRRMAHVGVPGGTAAWIAACLALLAPRGTLLVVHRAEALPALLQALDRRAGGVTLLPVHTREALPAKRILVRAVAGSRAPMALLPGLVLNRPDGPTADAERISRGEPLAVW